MKKLSDDYLRSVKFWYVILLFIVYMMICFLIPTLVNGNWTERFSEKENVNTQKNDDITNVGDVHSIKLLLTESNQVVELSLEDYLKGVLIGEVPITYELEALKAQAVVARTYTLYKLKNAPSKHAYGADMCDDINCCQAYKTKEYAFASWEDNEENQKWAKLEEAVRSTNEEVIVYSGDLINAFFHAHSGGKTENVKYLWAKEEIPYLVSVDGNEGYVYQDSKTFQKDEFATLLKDDINNLSGDIQFQILSYTGSGRVENININGVTMEGGRLRNLTGIKSTNFRVEQSGDWITFYTVGYGHGVGMSQEGANQMALNGSNHEEIIKHYYTGAQIAKSFRQMNSFIKYVKNTFIGIWRCFFMILHSDRKIICVKDIPSNIFDEAIFILKENVAEVEAETEDKRTKEIILSEAEEIVDEYISRMQNEKIEQVDIQKLEQHTNIREMIYIVGLLIILGICISVVI